MAKVLIFSPNGNPSLRHQMKAFAMELYPGDTILERSNVFKQEFDLEPADAVIILEKDLTGIGMIYKGRGKKVKIFEPEPLEIITPPKPIEGEEKKQQEEQESITIISATKEPDKEESEKTEKQPRRKPRRRGIPSKPLNARAIK